MQPVAVLTHWVHDDVVEFLHRHFRVIPNTTKERVSRAIVLDRASEADALMVFMPDRVDEELLAACPKLKIVSAALKGFDNIDVQRCSRRGVWVTIVPDLLIEPTAELTVGLLIGLARRVLAGDRFVRTGQFSGWRPKLYGTGLRGQCAGIIGMGALGQAVAARLAGFGMKLVYADPRPLTPARETDLKVERLSHRDLYSVSDFVLVCAPLIPETLHMVNAEALAAMKPGAYLVNTGRGSVVDERAVLAALESGHLAGYAADVFEMEDRSRENRPFTIPGKLLEMPERTLFTPHLGSAVDRVRRDIAMEAAVNMVQAMRGERPQGAINEPGRSDFSPPVTSKPGP